MDFEKILNANLIFFNSLTSVIVEFPTSNFIFVTFYLCKKRSNQKKKKKEKKKKREHRVPTLPKLEFLIQLCLFSRHRRQVRRYIFLCLLKIFRLSASQFQFSYCLNVQFFFFWNCWDHFFTSFLKFYYLFSWRNTF